MQDRSRRKQQFELERALRGEILRSPKELRTSVFASAYEQLFAVFPDHSVFDASTEEGRGRGRLSAGLIAPLLRKSGGRILEVGCGRGDTLAALQGLGYECVGVEPSVHMMDACAANGVTVHFGTADSLDFPDDYFDAVFCQEVIEHLHPEDVPCFFAEAHRVLRRGGVLSVETPNRTTGPQDISREFTEVAQGLHLKEYSVYEVLHQFKVAGFTTVRGLLAPQCAARRCSTIHRLTRVPARVKHLEDLLLRCVPGRSVRTLIGKFVGLDDIFLFGRKKQPSR
jgi:SAM-dependent methyltransferase